MWSDHYQTPRSVWTVSAIAATAFHAGVIGWGLTVRQTQPRIAPAPIQVIALPAESTADVSPASEAATAVEPAPNSALSSTRTNPDFAEPPIEPVEPSDMGDPSTSAAPIPATTTNRPDPPVTQAESPGSSAVATPAPSDSATPPSTAPPEIPELPSVEPTVDGSRRPLPLTTGDLETDDFTDDVGLQTAWQLQLLGADIPEELPQAPLGWPQAMNAVFNDANCATNLMPPGTSIQTTVRPIVEADGRISAIRALTDDDNPNSAIVAACLNSLTAQIPPLIPARDGGDAIASDAMILIIEIRAPQ
ncbi:hypothetical protein PN498_25685 [Oscillatoria sp. CS-180]|uniref:hypothetical protein n=1 Tax=Oscillatoria sp. CS-180 TaxID=3021720 RepID=UPI00232B52F1|nr:hypothetical protein [Oscillatoria sp. CS-180]MDB9529409.1 hypothetical protein [Oscillatoria sp. CS-180]